jgi:hypothetical protein
MSAMSEKEAYSCQIAIAALISLSAKPKWTHEEHSRFYFKTMDKKTAKPKLEQFYNEITHQKI